MILVALLLRPLRTFYIFTVCVCHTCIVFRVVQRIVARTGVPNVMWKNPRTCGCDDVWTKGLSTALHALILFRVQA